MNALQYPSALHLACTFLTVGHEQEFLDDLKESIKEASASPIKDDGMAAIYGTAANIPDRSIVGDVARGFIDCLYLP